MTLHARDKPSPAKTIAETGAGNGAGSGWRPARHWHTPDWHDAVAMALVVAAAVLLGLAIRPMAAPFAVGHQATISLAPSALPWLAVRTTMRMLAALVASLLFTFTYATLAAKSRRARLVLIPLLDVLQSVPILGYLSFTVVFFLRLVPGRQLGPELAAIFAIFTSQAWNMTFSFYQSLRTVPHDLEESARSFHFSPWQRFWRLEVPFAMPGLVWNMMMSMSGGWFFVVAAEAISVGHLQLTLPGIGSYVALAIAHRDLVSVGWAIAAMVLTILAYDQLLFRPLVAWGANFRYEQTAAQSVSGSWVRDLFARAHGLDRLAAPLMRGIDRAGRARLRLPFKIPRPAPNARLSLVADRLWLAAIVATMAYGLWGLVRFETASIGMGDITTVAGNAALTLLRVVVLMVLASLIWVPIGVGVGLRPKLAARVQPIAQFLAAFPANLLFPIAVFVLLRFHLSPRIWLTPLMILGTQWYMLFNVIAGASAFPTDLREAASTFHIRRWRWWRDVMLPGIFPYYVTGAITASGGCWNASIVAEIVTWGSTRLNGGGLGAYIAVMTGRGDFARIILGVVTMSAMVIAMNLSLWQPLYRFAERRTRLD